MIARVVWKISKLTLSGYADIIGGKEFHIPMNTREDLVFPLHHITKKGVRVYQGAFLRKWRTKK